MIRLSTGPVPAPFFRLFWGVMTRLLRKIAAVPSLTVEYNLRGRHPLQGVKRVYNPERDDAGNIRFGVPLAAVAVIAGALSYALVDYPAPHYSVPRAETSVIALDAIEPAAGELKAPEPVSSRNGELVMDMSRAPSTRKLITINDLDDSGVLADETAAGIMVYDDTLQQIYPAGRAPGAAVPVMDRDGYYADSAIAPVAYKAVETPAQRVVSVQRKAGAGEYKSQMASATRALTLGQYDAAMEMFEALRRNNPDDVRVLMGLAVAQQRFGLDEAAQHTYESVLALDPDHAEATVNMLGLMQDDKPEEARAKLASLWNKNPQSPAIAAQLGLLSAQLGQTDDAMRYVGIAASLEPHNAGHLYNMAVISDRKGGRGRAIELYEKALEIDATYGAGKSVPRDMIYDRLYYLRRS